ncbi:MAG: threonine ammonia-lyase [Nitrospiraceae bacterium]|nr:threonine ammonia-lyase [Nitrospiraceae bacterium]
MLLGTGDGGRYNSAIAIRARGGIGKHMVAMEDIRRAAGRIAAFVHKTPLIYSSSFSRMTGAEVYLKAENLQKTGSFKVRGACNRIMDVRGGSVIAASMGNHAQGVAFAAGRLGKAAKIVMPVTAPIVKQEATEGYGAEVLLFGESFNEALSFARSQAGYEFIHAFDDDAVIAGQGTVGTEIAEDMSTPDCVLVPVGGGGLISGIAVAMKGLSPATQIIGVQATAAPSAALSFQDRHVQECTPRPTIADGIAVGRVGEKTFEIISRFVDDMLTVEEDGIAEAVLYFLERKKLVVEGAGSVALAALFAERQRFSGKKVVLVVSGGNIDFTLVDRIIHKGLLSGGRIGVFEAVVDDLPGVLHTLSGIIAARRGNILNVVHERLAPGLPVVKTKVIFTVETRGRGHLEEILSDCRQKGFEVRRRSGD